jgi:hypothetical protein
LRKLEQGVIGDQTTLTSKSNEPTGSLHRLSVQGTASVTLNESESLDGEIDPEAAGGLTGVFIDENDYEKPVRLHTCVCAKEKWLLHWE